MQEMVCNDTCQKTGGNRVNMAKKNKIRIVFRQPLAEIKNKPALTINPGAENKNKPATKKLKNKPLKRPANPAGKENADSTDIADTAHDGESNKENSLDHIKNLRKRIKSNQTAKTKWKPNLQRTPLRQLSEPTTSDDEAETRPAKLSELCAKIKDKSGHDIIEDSSQSSEIEDDLKNSSENPSDDYLDLFSLGRKDKEDADSDDQPVKEDDHHSSISYGELVKRNSHYFSQQFELHVDNLPSSEKTMKRILSSLKQNKFSFDYKQKITAPSPIKNLTLSSAILSHLVHAETNGRRPSVGFLNKQENITESMRTVLLDWLSEVCASFKLHVDSFYMAVTLIDCYMSARQMKRNRFQLLGCAALFISSKFGEVVPPIAKDFVMVADSSFSLAELFGMEVTLMETIGWCLPIPPHMTLANELLKGLSAAENQKRFCLFAIELAQFESDLAVLRPSQLVSAAAFVALHLEKGESGEISSKNGGNLSKRILKLLMEKVKELFGIKIDNIQSVVGKLKRILIEPNKREHFIRRKYDVGNNIYDNPTKSAVLVAKCVTV